MAPSMKVYELDEKPNYIKISKFLNFEGKGYIEKDLKKNHLITKLCSMGSKCLA
jgi:hypothetical protein